MSILPPIDTGSPINREHPLNRGLISWWLPLPLRGVGSKLIDIAGKNDGTLYNAPTWSPYGHGFYGINFTSGSFHYVKMGGATAPTTVAFWLKIDVSANASCIYAGSDVYDSTFYTWSCFMFSGTLYLGGNGAGAFVTEAITTGRWDHYVINRSDADGVCRVYKNGVVLGTAASTSTSSGVTRMAKAGAAYFSGGVRELTQWSRPLLAREVWQFYQESRQGYPNLLRRLPVRGKAAGTAGASITTAVAAMIWGSPASTPAAGASAASEVAGLAWWASAPSTLAGAIAPGDVVAFGLGAGETIQAGGAIIAAEEVASNWSAPTLSPVGGATATADASSSGWAADSPSFTGGALAGVDVGVLGWAGAIPVCAGGASITTDGVALSWSVSEPSATGGATPDAQFLAPAAALFWSAPEIIPAAGATTTVEVAPSLCTAVQSVVTGGASATTDAASLFWATSQTSSAGGASAALLPGSFAWAAPAPGVTGGSPGTAYSAPAVALLWATPTVTVSTSAFVGREISLLASIQERRLSASVPSRTLVAYWED